jgi:lariat debranching enzyme
MKVAVAGCVHGALDKLYQDFEQFQKQENGSIDLLLVCGDVQTVRNEPDLLCMAVPPKYRALGDFHRYYTGERKAPVLTLFIGGNHEAYSYLMGLPYGGWVAPNMYYVGYANVLRYKGIRIAGLTGIFCDRCVQRSHDERLPLDNNALRHVYHSRFLDTWRMMQLRTRPEVVMSHDWPRGVEHYGDIRTLLKIKPFFRQDIDSQQLGNDLHRHVLSSLRPAYWFAGHLHVKYKAQVHFPPDDKSKINPVHAKCPNFGQTSEFLALDKCLPRRPYLTIMDLPFEPSESIGLEYDAEWLAILKTSIERRLDQGSFFSHPPHLHEQGISDEEFALRLKEVNESFGNDFKVPDNFSHSEPVIPGQADPDARRQQTYVNDQTKQFCWQLGIRLPDQVVPNEMMTVRRGGPHKITANANELQLSDEEKSGKPSSGEISLVD